MNIIHKTENEILSFFFVIAGEKSLPQISDKIDRGGGKHNSWSLKYHRLLENSIKLNKGVVNWEILTFVKFLSVYIFIILC